MENVKKAKGQYVTQASTARQAKRVQSLRNITVILLILELCDSLISIYTTIVPKIFGYILYAVLIIVATLYIKSQKKLIRLIRNLIPAVLYFVFCAVKFFIGGNFSNNFWSPIKLCVDAAALILCVVMVHAVISMPQSFRRFILECFLILGAFTVLPSLYYVSFFPDAVRSGYGGFGNVNFTYIYATIPLVVLSFCIIKSKNCKKKFFVLLYFITNLLMIFRANFATAFVSTLLGLVLISFCTRKNSFRTVISVIAVSIILLLILRYPTAELIYKVSEIGQFSPIMQKRITAIGDFLSGKGGGTSFGARLDLMLLSWKSFLQYPIFGIPTNLYMEGNVGLHETWVTLLGTTGIFGVILYMSTLFLLLRNIFKRIRVSQFGVAYKLILLLCIFVGFLNPLTFRDAVLSIFFISPLFEVFFIIPQYSKPLRESICV